MSRYIIRCIGLLLVSVHISALSMNMTRPWNPFIKPSFDHPARGYGMVYFEKGFDAQGFDACGRCVNVLRIWNKDQDALAMLEGFPADSAIGELRTLIDAADDGVRGHFTVDGCLDFTTVGFSVNAALPWDFFIGFYMPVHTMKLSNVVWHNETQSLSAQDERVKTYLTNNFFQNVQELGCLNLQGWKRAGLGDSALLLEWVHDFVQYKKLLKNVRLDCRFGITLPTGLQQDEDKLFALPFGADGSTGVLWGGALTITLGDYVKAGFDVELLHLFGHSKERRVKTDVTQTDLLLLAKTCAYKEWGFTQQFLLFAQLYHIVKGFSCEVYYEFRKRGDSKLSVLTNDYSNHIVNTARSLEEWTSHTMIVKPSYDCGVHMTEHDVQPTIFGFAKIPFNGRNIALSTTMGIGLELKF